MWEDHEESKDIAPFNRKWGTADTQIQPLNERSVDTCTLQGVSREVQADKTAAIRIIRETYYTDPSGI